MILKCAVLFVLLALSRATIIPLHDGNLVTMYFEKDESTVQYDYKHIDPLGTFSLNYFGTEVKKGYAVLKLISGGKTIITLPGYDIYERDQNDPLPVGQYTIEVTGGNFGSFNLFITSGVRLENYETFEMVANKEGDTFDYNSFYGYRFFRVFLCDDDVASLVVTDSENTETTKIYAKDGRFPHQGMGVGRPMEGSSELDGTEVSIADFFTTYGNSYVYFGVFVGTTGPGTRTITVQAKLETAELTIFEHETHQDSLCLYEECHQAYKVSLDHPIVDNTTIAFMPRHSIQHTIEPFFRIEAGVTNPPKDSLTDWFLSIHENIFTFGKHTVDEIFANTGEHRAYISLFSAAHYHYPMIEHPHLDYYISQWTDTAIVKTNFFSLSLTLPKVSNDGTKVYNTILLNTIIGTAPVGLSHSKVTSDYIVRAIPSTSLESGKAPGNITMGWYMGGYSEDIHSYTDPSAALRKSVVMDEYVSGSSELTISNTHESYCYDCVYAVEVWGDSNKFVDTVGQPIKIEAARLWHLNEYITYSMDLPDYSATNHFRIKPGFPEKGFGFGVKLLTLWEGDDVSDTNEPVTIYISNETKFPGPNSIKKVYTATGKGEVYLFIQPEEMIGKGDVWYVSIQTYHENMIRVKYESGEYAQIEISNGETVHNYLTGIEDTQKFVYRPISRFGRPSTIIRISFSDEEGNDVPYIGENVLNVCISDTSNMEIGNCPGRSTSLDATNPLRIVLLTEVSITGKFLFLHTIGNDPLNEKPLRYSIYAESYLAIDDDSRSTFTVVEKYEQFLLQYTLGSGEDSTLTFFLDTLNGGSASYDIAICPHFPPKNFVDAQNNEDCVVSLVNNIGGVNMFIDELIPHSSTSTWISLFPLSTIVGSTITVGLYLDNTVLVNERSFVSTSPTQPEFYGRIHIPELRFHEGAEIKLVVNTTFPMFICLSDTTHTYIGSELCKHTVDIEFTPTGERVLIESEKSYDLVKDMKFDLKRNNSIFFTLGHKEGVEAITVSDLYIRVIESVFIWTPGAGADMVLSPFSATPYSYNYFRIRQIKENCPDRENIGIFSQYDVRGLNHMNTPKDFFDSKHGFSSVWFQGTEKVTPDMDKTSSTYVDGRGVIFGKVPIDTATAPDLFTTTGFIESYMYKEVPYLFYATCNPDKIPEILDVESSPLVNTGVKTGADSKLYAVKSRGASDTISLYPCAGRGQAYVSYLRPDPNYDCSKYVSEDTDSQCVTIPDPAYQTNIMEPYTMHLTAFNGSNIAEKYGSLWFFLNVTDSDAGKLNPDSRFHVQLGANHVTTGPFVPTIAFSARTSKGGVTVTFSSAQPGHENGVDVEYALYAMRTADQEEPTFDASPYTSCGMAAFGLPLYRSGNKKTGNQWVRFSKSGTPKTQKIVSNIRPDKLDWNNDDFCKGQGAYGRANYFESKSDRYYYTILTREIDGNGKPIEYGIYEVKIATLKGDLPGIDQWWEILLIVLACLAVVALIGALVWWIHQRKMKERGYQVVDKKEEAKPDGDTDREVMDREEVENESDLE